MPLTPSAHAPIMPRPKRDYGVAIRDDLAKLDLKIRDLLERRVRLQRMLADYETAVDIDVTKAIRELPQELTTRKSAGARRKR